MRIFNDDGTKEFKTVEEFRLWEEEDYCKQKKEQEERAKAVAKAEAERKIAEEKRKQLINERTADREEIRVKAEELLKLQNKYRDKHGVQVYVGSSSNGVIARDVKTFGDMMERFF